MRCIALAAMVICAGREARAEPACYAKAWNDCVERVDKLEQEDAARKKRGDPTTGAAVRDKWEDECLDDHVASSCVLAAIARTRGYGGRSDELIAVSWLWIACESDEKVCDLVVAALDEGLGVPRDTVSAEEIRTRNGPPKKKTEEEETRLDPSQVVEQKLWARREVGELSEECYRGKASSCTKAAVAMDAREPEIAYALFFLACDFDRTLCIDISHAYQEGKKVGANKKYAKRFRKLALAREGDVGCRYGRTDKCVTNGHAFLKGKHVARDREYAVVLFEEACRAKDPDGCAGLAEAYWAKPKRGKDRRTAVELYRKACDDRSATACWKLGRLYLRGEHIGQDAKRAEKLFARACELGDQAGCKYVGDKP